MVNFEDKQAFYCFDANTSSGGLNYSLGGGVDCYYSTSNPADFPTLPPSTVMASGFGDTTFSRPGNGLFSVASVDLAFGPFGHSGLQTDTTLVTGTLFDNSTISTVLNVGFGFQTYQLGWSDLKSISFSLLQGGGEYLAFDNLVYTTGVPEPASWMLLLAGFGLAGGALRRRRLADRVVSC
ncbi:PEPxxWA-CTERM sorting domain-containing protein [Sandarakinorhabdus oryzae]|uniref:PEPxxWA-CTERM sorting domain-containing protein n=1 Tax=Sandarakinorhabdus oryzae TaxID=2675220 RepID=UPI0012E21F90|nr:PEPxxWA-CTERM sorting domain-containing protein [Sandarakinorhabdus oryzae]